MLTNIVSITATAISLKLSDLPIGYYFYRIGIVARSKENIDEHVQKNLNRKASNVKIRRLLGDSAVLMTTNDN